METILTRLADQIPTAVLFAVFVMVLLSRQDKRDEARDEAQAKRDELMRQFWQQTINSLLSGMAEIRGGQEEHDKWVREHTSTPRRRAP